MFASREIVGSAMGSEKARAGTVSQSHGEDLLVVAHSPGCTRKVFFLPTLWVNRMFRGNNPSQYVDVLFPVILGGRTCSKIHLEMKVSRAGR
jgi:hypothetical protein